MRGSAPVVARLHSVSAVVLAAFLGMHLVQTWPIAQGREAWIAAVASRGSGHAWGVILVALLAVHATLGLVRSLRAVPTEAQGGRGMLRVQLVTGCMTAAFVALHLVQVEWLGVGPHRGALHGYALLRHALDTAGVLLAYLLGITAAVFHASHGVSRVPFSWGLAITTARVRAARYVAGVAGFALWLAWLHVLSHLAIGTGLVGGGR